MAKKESSFINMVLTLFIVTGVAALALGGVYNLTKEPIALAKKAKLENAISNVIPEFDTLNEFKVMPATGKDSLTFYEAFYKDSLVGTAIKTYTNEGFSGFISIMAGFSPDGIIINTAVLEHKETPGLGDKMDVTKSVWSNQFKNINPKDFDLHVIKDGGNVDAITAATISSRAFCDAMRRANKTYETQKGGTK